jgi:hypothetical protein
VALGTIVLRPNVLVMAEVAVEAGPLVRIVVRVGLYGGRFLCHALGRAVAGKTLLCQNRSRRFARSMTLLTGYSIELMGVARRDLPP